MISSSFPTILPEPKMHTVDGSHAEWPITHWFFQESTQEQHQIQAETAAMARQMLEFCNVHWDGALTCIQSKDAQDRFVYDNE